MNVEQEKKLLRGAQVRAIRAVRLALIALFDASADIVANFPGDPSDEPEEIEQARIKAWNTTRPLLILAAKSLKAFATSGGLGADRAMEAVELCENVLRTLGNRELQNGDPTSNNCGSSLTGQPRAKARRK